MNNLPLRCAPSRCGRTVAAAAALALLAPAPAAAVDDAAAWQWRGGAGVEWFEWEEFYQGRREVRESGPRLLLTSTVDNAALFAPGPLYAAAARVTFGRVDYAGTARGEDAAGDSFVADAESETDYRALHLVAEGGWRFAAGSNGTTLIDSRAGVELDRWSRTLLDTRDVDHDAIDVARGYTENYLLLTARASAGTTHRVGNNASWQWRFGLRYPFFVDQYDSVTGATLRPKGRAAWFVETAWRHDHRPWSLHAYYETYRFDDSDWVDLGTPDGRLIKQPRSESFRAGVVVQYRLR